MSRPAKAGVEYFPLDVDNDDKLDLIEAEFGLTGFAVIVKLYQRIYKLGYYCEWNEEVALLFGKRLGLGGSAVSEIVSAAIRRSLFDADVYNSQGVLTSKGIQKRYFEIVGRRKNVEVEQRYLLVPHTLVPDNVRIMYTETPVNVYIEGAETPENVYRSTQSKVKESKVKESSCNADDDNPFGYATGARPSLNTVEAYATSNLTHMSLRNMEDLVDFKNRVDEDVIRHAIDEACAYGKRSWGYVRIVLNEWINNGLRTMGDVKAHEERRRKSKQAEAEPSKPKYRILE